MGFYDIYEFGDSEAEFVRALDISLKQLNIENARVSTKRLPESKRSDAIPEIIVRSVSKLPAGNEMEEQFTLYIFCSNRNENIAFKQANDLTYSVIVALKKLKPNSKMFRSVFNVSSSPFQDEGETQIRSVLASVISYGKRKRITT